MITVDEIRKKSENFYTDFLKSIITGEFFFPKVIRSNKSVSDDFNEMRKELAELIEFSKDKKNFGYTIVYKKVTTRKHGVQDLPDEINFQTETDYLKFIKKEKEVVKFKENIHLILSLYPNLKSWLLKYPTKVIDNERNWNDFFKVCDYFSQNPNPNLYLRELPIVVHTKFIEQNKSILAELLKEILPETAVNLKFKEFEKRFGLKYNQSRIRLRILDTKIAEIFFSKISDVEINQTDFDVLNLPCKYVFILENKTNFSNLMNFLTLPQLDNSIAIFGSGFKVGSLKNAEWLNQKEIYYWGDIDTHGLQALDQVKGYFPHTKSIMMDFATLNCFKDDWGIGEKTNVSELSNLNEDELKLFNYLKENDLRLEQEKISHEYVLNFLKLIY